MRETLYLRLRELSPSAPTTYSVTGPEPGASIFVRLAPLEEVIDQARGRRVIVFVSGSDVRLTQVKVPARQPAKVLQAAPFVLEDQFAEDVETLHFALGARRADGTFPVAAVAHERIEAWLEPFRKAGVSITALVPETLALPWDEVSWPVLVEPGLLTVRTGASNGFSCLPEDLETYLQLAGGESNPPLRMLMTQGSSQDFTQMQRPVELLPGFFDPLEALVRHLRLAQSINLLQSEYSQRQEFDRLWRPWRLAVAAIVLAFILGVALNFVQGLSLSRSANKQDDANLQRYHQLFPNEKSNVNLESLVAQKEQMMHTTHAQGGLLFLMQQIAQSLAATPGLVMKTLQFRDGALFMDLGGTDVQLLEKLQGWFLAHPGTKLEVISVDAGASDVKIRLKLSPA